MKQTIFIAIIAVTAFTLAACNILPTADKKQTADNKNNDASKIAADLLTDGLYTVDQANSQIVWQAAKISAKHTGLIALKSGELKVEGGKISSASFIVDMTTISSNENLSGLVQHLKGPDFFDVTVYPEAKLIIKSTRVGTKAGEYFMDGELTIKDISAPIELTAEIKTAGINLEAQSAIKLDRTKWNIKYLSGNIFKDLGDKAIDDTINFTVSINAKR